MPKKSKGSSSQRGKSLRRSGDSLLADKKAARISKIYNLRDAGFQGQDAFGLGDDEISLEPGYGHPHSLGNDGDDLSDMSDEEVLGLHLTPSDATNAVEVPQSVAIKARRKGSDKDLLPLTTARTSRFAGRPTTTTASDDDESDSDRADGSASAAENALSGAGDDYDGEWARTGGYHVTKGEIERRAESGRRKGPTAEDEEREQLDLFETRRIQQEARSRLDEHDFGIGNTEGEDLPSDIVIEHGDKPAPVSQLLEFPSREDAIAHLLAREPELLALLDDLTSSSERLAEHKLVVEQLQQEYHSDNPKVGFAVLYQELLGAYLMLISYYLHLRSQPFGSHGHREHLCSPVLVKLVKLKEALSTIDDLGLVTMPAHPNDSHKNDPHSKEEDSFTKGQRDLERLDREQLVAELEDLEEDTIEELIKERDMLLASNKTKQSNAAAITTNNIGLEGSGLSTSHEAKSSRKRKRAPRRKTAGEAAADDHSLLNLNVLPTASSISATTRSAGSDLLDPIALSSADAAEKADRKKSLRFYTSKIESKSAKRTGAGKERAGGDDDVPYRSKERARTAALQKQQHGKDAAAADLDDADFDASDIQTAQAIANDADADGYYDLVASGTTAVKRAKKAAYDEAIQEDRAARDPALPLDPNNPRAVNRQIMANKGLTPKRPKSVRNPRVKKRMRYDKAQKKVASMKPVYKGGLGSASYEGEKSGISSRVVKSRSL